ncbi:MAG: CD1871A family CXXC motif-containing protein [Clostridia bacterium]|nr:CD1871A family CXXC motif-containing protein [Clostridia bacterium]
MNKHAIKNLVWIALLILAAGMICFGCLETFAREEWRLVLDKAINICFECIGLG